MAEFDHYWQCDASLPDHPKIHRLADELGVRDLEAIGIVTSLFSRVRRHAPSGDLSAISDRTLALWSGHRRVTRTALTSSGWVDVDGRLHGWSERYERLDAARARHADRQRRYRDAVRGACASRDGSAVRVSCASRDDEEEEEEVEEEDERDDGGSSDETSPDRRRDADVRKLFQVWNALADEIGLPIADKLSKARRGHARQRIADGLLEKWEAFAAAMRGPAGEWHRAKGVGFDWLLTPGKALGLLERASRRPPRRPPPAGPEIPFDGAPS